MNFPPLFSFTGRVARGPMWLLMLAAIVFAVLVNVVVYFVLGGVSDENGNAHVSPVALVLYAGLYLVIGVIGVSFQVRRCHDRDRSGWFVLLWLLPILNIWGLVEMYFLSGTPGTNRFGPDPLRRDLATTAEAFR